MELSFSKGTLILNSQNRLLNESILPVGFKWDERIKQYRAPAYLYRKTTEYLLEKRLPFTDNLKTVAGAQGFWKPIDLYPYQEKAKDNWLKAKQRGLMAMPTGSGKSRVAINLIKTLNVSTLILVPTRALQDQWLQNLKAFYEGEIGIVGDGENNLTAFTICTFESAYRHMWHFGSRFELMIVDEAHHFGCGVRDEALVMSSAHKRLGLTASLPKDETHLKKLCNLLGPVVFTQTINELKGEYLADFVHVPVYINLSKEILKEYRESYGQYQVFSSTASISWQRDGWNAFRSVALKSEKGRQALKSAQYARQLVSLSPEKILELERLLARHWTDRVFIFVSNTKDICTITERLLAYPICADIKKSERKFVLRSFEEGRIRSIVSCKVLNEGIDVPTANVAIIVGGSANEREQIQRIGRVLRKAPGKVAYIYEFITNQTFEVHHSRRRNTALN